MIGRGFKDIGAAYKTCSKRSIASEPTGALPVLRRWASETPKFKARRRILEAVRSRFNRFRKLLAPGFLRRPARVRNSFLESGHWPYKDQSWKAGKKWNEGLQTSAFRCKGTKVTALRSRGQGRCDSGRHLSMAESKHAASKTLPIQLPRTQEASRVVLIGSYMSTQGSKQYLPLLRRMSLRSRSRNRAPRVRYRRDDARGASGRLYDWLRIAFGSERVFRDVHSIGIGKWRDKIDRALARSKVCVAVIGPRWANAENMPRLHQPDDMVRHELVSALHNEAITLVPTLIEGAKLPETAELPAELRALFDVWNARCVTEDGWEDDTRRLIAEIAESTSLLVGPDLDSLLHDVNAARQRVAELEQTRHLQAEQLDAQRRAIDDLTRKLAEASAVDRPGLAAAFAALARGDSLAAEDAFEREYDAQSRVLESARQTMVEAARNVANLALSRDVNKAVTFYRKALQIEPEHAETLRFLGRALMLLGDLQAATRAIADSLRVSVDNRDEWGEMAAQGGLGEVRLQTGDLSGAHAAFTSALSLAGRRFALDPANTEWQRDLSVSHEKIGDLLVAQGDGAGALAAYRSSLTLREALIARDPANTQWQRDLSVSHNKIGDVLVAQGDGAGALAAYRSSLTIAKALAARDPANTQWQRDLIISYVKLSEVTGDKGFVLQAAKIAQDMQQRGILAPRDIRMLEDLARRS